MNSVRAYPWILIGWLLSNSADATAVKQLPESSFKDWSGIVQTIDLHDQSVLFEYTARSFSGSTGDAMLAISFVPRFNCEPTISVSLSYDTYEFQEALVSPQLQFTFGSERRTYAGLVDRVRDTFVYSVAASALELQSLRDIIDGSSRMNIRVFSGSDDASRKASSGYELVFSLLGSKLSTLAAEKYCLSHEPLAYDPR